MLGSRWLAVVVVLTALLVHLPAHVSPFAPHIREALPEDAPAILANQHLEERPGETFGDVLKRVAVDPSAAWDPAGEVVGRSRFRPVSAVTTAVVRRGSRKHPGAAIGFLALLLHAGVALLTVGLVRDLTRRGRSRSSEEDDAPAPRAAWIAGMLVATAPCAIAVVDWPARYALVLALVLGLGGVRIALRGGMVAALIGGALAAAAGLAHEWGFGVALAGAVLLALRPGKARNIAAAVACLVPTALALLWRVTVLSDYPSPDVAAGPNVLDAAAGWFATLIAPLVPGRLHVGDGPWVSSAVMHVVALVGLAFVGWRAWTARARPVGQATLAAMACASPVLLVAFVGGTPFQHGYAYAVLPFVALATAFLVRGALDSAALRRPAVAAAALLIGASVVTTVTTTPQVRSRAGFVAAMSADSPDGNIVTAWRIGDAVDAARADGGDVHESLDALLPEIDALVGRLRTPAGELTEEGLRLRRDAAGAVTVSVVLAGAASAFVDAVPKDRPELADIWLWRMEQAALTARDLAPEWPVSWLVLARLYGRLGAVDDALDAAVEAAEIESRLAGAAETVAQLALQVGRTDIAVSRLSEAYADELERARMTGQPPRRSLRLQFGRALAADAATRGLVQQFEQALQVLQPMFEEGDRREDLQRALYETFIQYGDALTSLDKTAMAKLSYDRAQALGGPRSVAAEHRTWLLKRLADELREAQRAMALAQTGEGNAADALLKTAIAYARQANWDEARAVFDHIETQQGGMTPELRLARAVHLHAARTDELPLAADELRRALEEAPGLHDARYSLAAVLLQLGRIEDAIDEYERAGREGAGREWAIDALLTARRLRTILETPLR